MTKPKRYKRYSPEFKREAIRRAASEGKTDKGVCDELGISLGSFGDGEMSCMCWVLTRFQDRAIVEMKS